MNERERLNEQNKALVRAFAETVCKMIDDLEYLVQRHETFEMELAREMERREKEKAEL